MAKFDCKILGSLWMIHIHADEDFHKKFGDEDAAFVLPGKKQAHFNLEELSMEVVTHEVWHIYRASSLTSSAGLSAEQEEEVSAEQFACFGDSMVRFGRKLYKELKKLGEDL